MAPASPPTSPRTHGRHRGPAAGDRAARGRYVDLSHPVDRTVKYTATQVITNWAAWPSIVTVVAGWVTFLRGRRRRVKDTAGPAAVQQVPADASTQMGHTPGG
ncbi:MAG TPA: hypothetical protein VFL38_17550 [Humibacillus xanthopallidus]|nr:hypothetical protein [Humibacillus xanthopallidus]